MDFNRALDLFRKDPDWLKKCALPGVLFFVTMWIPLVNIAGAAALLGWQRRTFEAAREERELLAEHDIGADLAYGVDPLIAIFNALGPLIAVSFAVFGLPMVGNLFLVAALQGSSLAGPLSLALMLMQVVGMFLFAILGFFSALALPELLRRGFRGERWPLLTPGRSIAIIKAQPVPYLILCGAMMAANVAGGTGMYLCCVGLVITQPVAAAFAAHLLGQWDAQNPEG